MITASDILDNLHRQLIVSCQPVKHGQLDRVDFVTAIALAAIESGAAGVRIEGVDNVTAVANRLNAPIIGIVKHELVDYPVHISPFEQDIENLAAAGAAIIAVDATNRSRPVSVETLVRKIHACGCVAMADCATLDDGLAAADLGCEFIATTLSGYTGGPEIEDPDFDLIEHLAARGLTVMAEGRIRAPHQAVTALSRGAWSVTVGSAITRVEHITGWFANALANCRETPGQIL